MPKRTAAGVGIIPEKEARSLLDDIHEKLFRTVTHAFDRMQDGPLGLTTVPHVGHLTNAMHALMTDEARLRFSDCGEVEVLDGQTFLLKVRERLLVRFKKVDLELRTSNYPTRRANAFDAQATISDLPPLPRVTVGYEPDDVWSQLVSVSVAFSIRKRPMWHYELTGKSADGNVRPLSPLVDEIIVKPKPQLEMEDAFDPKTPR